MHRATLRQFLCQGFLFYSHQLWSCRHSWHEIWRPCRSVVRHTWYQVSTEFIRILLPVASAQQAMSSTWFHALWLLCAGKIPLEHRTNHISMKVEYQIQRSIPRHNAARVLFKKSLSRFLTLCKFRLLSLKPQEHSLQRVSHVPSERSIPVMLIPTPFPSESWVGHCINCQSHSLPVPAACSQYQRIIKNNEEHGLQDS